MPNYRNRILLHASLIQVEGCRFYPRVPTIRTHGEDSTIPRICFSLLLVDCIHSLPAGVLLLRNLMWLKREKGIQPVLYLYTLEPGEYQPENLMTPGKIKHFVPDAMLNQEFWIVNQEVVCHENIVLVDDFECYVSRNASGQLVHKRIAELRTTIVDALPPNNSSDYIMEMERRIITSGNKYTAIQALSTLFLDDDMETQGFSL